MTRLLSRKVPIDGKHHEELYRLSVPDAPQKDSSKLLVVGVCGDLVQFGLKHYVQVLKPHGERVDVQREVIRLHIVSGAA